MYYKATFASGFTKEMKNSTKAFKAAWSAKFKKRASDETLEVGGFAKDRTQATKSMESEVSRRSSEGWIHLSHQIINVAPRSELPPAK